MCCRTAFRSQKRAMRVCPVIPVTGRLCGSPVQRAAMQAPWETCPPRFDVSDLTNMRWPWNSDTLSYFSCGGRHFWQRSRSMEEVKPAGCCNVNFASSSVHFFVFVGLRKIYADEQENWMVFTHCLEILGVNTRGHSEQKEVFTALKVCGPDTIQSLNLWCITLSLSWFQTGRRSC